MQFEKVKKKRDQKKQKEKILYKITHFMKKKSFQVFLQKVSNAVQKSVLSGKKIIKFKQCYHM